MKPLHFPLILLATSSVLLSSQSLLARDLSPPKDSVVSEKARSLFEGLPLCFVENRGQMDPQVKYYLQGRDKIIYFTSGGLTMVLRGDGPPKEPAEPWVVKLDFQGADPKVVPRGLDPAPARISYFKGKKADWKTGLPTYRKIVYENLWPGIDLEYSGDVQRLKYQFVVKPGADPAKIRLSYRGISSLKVDGEGRLQVETGGADFSDGVPVGWQEFGGRRRPVQLAYALDKAVRSDAGSAYGFTVGAYDKTESLVLDPSLIVYCGYIGDVLSDEAYDIAVDGSGDAYVAGYTYIPWKGFPVKVGPDLSFNGGNNDAFVAKMSSDGTSLHYCGYIGGDGDEEAAGIAVDSAGNAYVAGWTGSSEFSFPVRVGPGLTFKGAINLGDAFVAKVSSDGTSLHYCGYIGGSGDDWANKIAVDGAGNAYVAGCTSSSESTFPVTVGPDLAYRGGSYDAFVAKVRFDGTGLDYCGYIGGVGDEAAGSIAVDGGGNAYVAGFTGSSESTFPVKVGPGLTFKGAVYFGDAFVAKVRLDGAGLDYCGYIGGSGDDFASEIAVDAAGNAYVAGSTGSSESTFPVIVGPHLTYHGGNNDAFVAKVRSDGTGFDYCGYIGGVGDDGATSVAVDGVGNAYVAGNTGSSQSTFPVIVGPDLTYNGGSIDAFVAKVRPDGANLAYCGYIGGRMRDNVYGIAVDGAGNVYVAGSTNSDEDTFPVAEGPYLTHCGFEDAFVAKVRKCSPVFVEDFSHGNLGGDPDWQELTGNWTVTPAKAFRAGAVANNKALVQNVPALETFTAGTVEVRMKLPLTALMAPNGGVLFAFKDNANFRYVKFAKSLYGGRLTIGQAGDPAVDGSLPFRKSRRITLVAGRFFAIKLLLYADGRLEVYRGRARLWDHKFARAAAGRVGLMGDKSRTVFDDFLVEDETALP